ncbi:Protein furry [Eumeta japonica]|uniref:Protein furry n=1 Tax=Eumeta variegata TaxID=151549 RepID=A0A4C1SYI4_EUMVA|nr:Protein furry [Eumeta japonica]
MYTYGAHATGAGGEGVGACAGAERERIDVPQPRPLPMPEYGGYFAPLTEYLPDTSQPISGFHRCNVAVMLLCDVVLDGVELDWSIHVPLMLHIVFLGIDHTSAKQNVVSLDDHALSAWTFETTRQLKGTIVHQHCRQLLLNLLVAVAAHHDHLTVARVLLASRCAQLGLAIPPPTVVTPHNFTGNRGSIKTYTESHSRFMLVNEFA